MVQEEHIELYKKYKPKTWDDLVGQEKTARSLRAAIVKSKIPTAYLMVGIRGTGKTSSAFLVAKSLNCLNRTSSGNPCNECTVCYNIDHGSQVGVNYISMANNGSVDDVRKLVNQSKLHQPVEKQVWILDEVHNLSKQAFDALLIPLEERNPNVLFILCSTEVEKIPDTILSRVQTRKFTLIDAETMTSLLNKINDKENLEATDEQILEAIRRGRGSVRDTLSNFEAILSTDDDMEEMHNAELLIHLSQHDLSNTLKTIGNAVNDGYDGRDVAEQLFADLRDLLLAVSGVDKQLIQSFPVEDVKSVAQGFLGRSGTTIALEEVGEALTHMTLGADSRIHLEIAVVKIITKLKKLKKIADNRE